MSAKLWGLCWRFRQGLTVQFSSWAGVSPLLTFYRWLTLPCYLSICLHIYMYCLLYICMYDYMCAAIRKGTQTCQAHTHSHVYSMCILYVFACLYSCTKYFTSVSSSLFYMNSSLRPIVFLTVFLHRAVSNLLLLRPNLQHGTAAPWGVGVFEVAEDLDGNATEVRLSRVVGEARDVCDLRSCASFLNCCL